jgi:hypothetical protein
MVLVNFLDNKKRRATEELANFLILEKKTGNNGIVMTDKHPYFQKCKEKNPHCQRITYLFDQNCRTHVDYSKCFYKYLSIVPLASIEVPI